MRITLALTLTVKRSEKTNEDGPQGTESLIIHQDQPRFIGFKPAETTDTDAARQ